MTVPGVEPASAPQVRCPTCRARQPWSDTCRRCSTDLRLLRQVDKAAQHARRRCLMALGDGRLADALRYAARCYWLRPDPAAAQLVAVCHLLSGNWFAALKFARRRN